MKKLLGIVSVLSLAAAASAASSQPLIEAEGNNTVPTANFVAAAFYPFGGVAIDGALVPGDVDYFSFDLTQGDQVGVAVYDFRSAQGTNPTPPGGTSPGTPGVGGLDSLLGVFGPGGVYFGADDDDNIAFLSSYQLNIPTTGRWSFAVSGFGDPNFDGVGHTQNGTYKLAFVINQVPEPASLALLGLGAALLLRRR